MPKPAACHGHDNVTCRMPSHSSSSRTIRGHNKLKAEWLTLCIGTLQHSRNYPLTKLRLQYSTAATSTTHQPMG